MVTNAANRSHLARRRNSGTLHIVTGVSAWYSGMTSTSECGVKRVDVWESKARPRHASDYCKRCVHSLGWDLNPTMSTHPPVSLDEALAALTEAHRLEREAREAHDARTLMLTNAMVAVIEYGRRAGYDRAGCAKLLGLPSSRSTFFKMLWQDVSPASSNTERDRTDSPALRQAT